jgi:hypothetical protein
MALSLVPLTQLSQNDLTLVLVNERSGATPERDPEKRARVTLKVIAALKSR